MQAFRVTQNFRSVWLCVLACIQHTGYAEGVWVVNVVTVIRKNFQCRHRSQARVDNEAKIGSQKQCNPFKATQLNNLFWSFLLCF